MLRIDLLIVMGVLAAASPADQPAFGWATRADAQADAEAMALAVDLTDLPVDGLVHARIALAAPGDGVLAFPRWIPGTHAPSGPVRNLGGLSVRDADGATIAWQRDARDPWLIHVAAPAARPLLVDLTYIANQPDENSEGVDIEGDDAVAVVNWNCCVFYPPQQAGTATPCAVTLRLPPAWDYATALPTVERDGDVVRFAALPLAEVIDRPLLAAATVKHLVLRTSGPAPEVMLHVAGRGDAGASVATLRALARLPDEADALFGGAWFARFDVLLRIGAAPLGLEHATSSLNGLPPDSLAEQADMWSLELMPHEFVHSWCGKHRRPAGMLTGDWQQPPDFDGLWVYEGLTELLGRVLAVRCGLADAGQWRDAIADDIDELAKEPGRRWRSLRDTCRCNWQLRAWLPVHAELRRGQDFYAEGQLLWLLIDHRLRAATAGRVALDDFCRSFLGPAPAGTRGFTEDELIAALAALAPAVDWRGLIARWIDGTGDLDVDAILGGSGWRLARVVVDGDDERALARIDHHELERVIGMRLEDGWVRGVTGGGPAASAGIAVGDFIQSADGAALESHKPVLTRAVAHSAAQRPVVLNVHHGDQWQQRSLMASDTLTVMTLVRDDGDDAFAALLAPRVAASAAEPVPADATRRMEPAAAPTP